MAGRVLIADDDETIRSILRHKLSGAGFELLVCEDGAEARDRLAESPDVDAVVLDVMMPRTNGTQVLRSIRRGELAVDADLPVVMLTSRGREEDVLEGLESGADDYVTKPFSPAELLARLRRALGE